MGFFPLPRRNRNSGTVANEDLRSQRRRRMSRCNGRFSRLSRSLVLFGPGCRSYRPAQSWRRAEDLVEENRRARVLLHERPEPSEWRGRRAHLLSLDPTLCGGLIVGGEPLAHLRVGLNVLHPVVVHNPEVPFAERLGHRAWDLGLRLDDRGTTFLD